MATITLLLSQIGFETDKGGLSLGHKVFVSYKYRDNDVKTIAGVLQPTRPCHYVDYMRYAILADDNIYKGEDTGDDISYWPEDRIWQHLKDKIYDSTITIVLISPNMKESGKWQRSQWIPWEISFSLRETTRNDRTSHNNAILAVVLPDKLGSYGYYDKNNLFPVLRSNIDNGYISVVTWNNFLIQPQFYINLAFLRQRITPPHDIVKAL